MYRRSWYIIELIKNLLYPHQFIGNIIYNSMLRFCIGPWHNILLLAFLRYNFLLTNMHYPVVSSIMILSNHHVKSWLSESAIIKISQTFALNTLQIFHNTFNSIRVRNVRMWHNLIHDTCRISNIRLSNY